jgi:5-oxoprolinase (ATP-hydrolysing) subunit A
VTGRMVDINSDIGESFGVYSIGEDEALMPWITSANLACGFHAGDPRVMLAAVRSAARAGVVVGAHPGLPDLTGFGRRTLLLTEEEAYTDTLYQLGALAAIARAAGVRLEHVKPHGQLNNLAVKDSRLAFAIVRAVQDFDPAMVMIAYAGELTAAAVAAGLTVANEVYADRAYRPDGSLLPRSEPGAIIDDLDTVIRRALVMVQGGKVTAVTGEEITVRADTICVHGDAPGAAVIARALRQALGAAGIEVRPLHEVIAARGRSGE